MVWAPDYVTLTEVRDEMRLKVGYVADDARITLSIGAASRAIDRHCNRQFGAVAVAEARVFEAQLRDDGRWYAYVDDLQDVTGLLVETDDGDAVTDYRLEPLNAAARGRPYERLRVGLDSSVLPSYPDYGLTVTGLWGWSAVPAAVRAACHLQVSRFFARRESPYGVAGSPDLGSELRLLAKVDPDVAVMLADYVRPRRTA